MAKGVSNSIGGWAFLVGVIVAVVLGVLGSLNSTVLWILVIVGIIVGLLNIADAETTPFMLSGVVLIIASALGQGSLANAGPMLNDILDALLAIFVPATVVVAIRNAYSMARR
jgi:uncharacterized membrane protein